MKCDFCRHKTPAPNAVKWITYRLREFRVTTVKGQVNFTDLPKPEVVHLAVCVNCLRVARDTSNDVFEGEAILPKRSA